MLLLGWVAPLPFLQASTLGSLEALLTFLATPEVNIPVSGARAATAPTLHP